MRSFFFRRSWRERMLLLVLLTAGVLVWLFAAAERVRSVRSRWSAQTLALKDQALWLDNAVNLQEQVQNRLAQVQQGRSLNANQLVGQLDAVAKRQRFGYRLDPPTTERKPPVAIHSVSLTIEKGELPALVAFTDELRTALPLVNVEQLVITPDRRNPVQVDVRLKLTGLELLP